MVDELRVLENRFSAVALGMERQLIMDIYRRGPIQPYQSAGLDRSNPTYECLARRWLKEGGDGGDGGADITWWQRLVGLAVIRAVEPSPDSASCILDLGSLPYAEEVWGVIDHIRPVSNAPCVSGSAR